MAGHLRPVADLQLRRAGGRLGALQPALYRVGVSGGLQGRGSGPGRGGPGASPWQRFWRILLPAARRGIGVGVTLSFAHTMGEFGVVLMLGGNIPGETRVASIALYDEVQQLNDAASHAYALVLLLVPFALLAAMNAL
ncbi:MAG: molybdate ABC transporter permease subunit [Pseudomonadota bacterium]